MKPNDHCQIVLMQMMLCADDPYGVHGTQFIADNIRALIESGIFINHSIGLTAQPFACLYWSLEMLNYSRGKGIIYIDKSRFKPEDWAWIST